MTQTKAQAEHKASLQFERMVFFSDAVFAIAITLLVLDLHLPPDAHGVISWDYIGPKLFGFFLSFAVIGLYWLDHHELFGGLHRDDAILRRVNLIFLVTVVFLPFPTSVITGLHATVASVALYAWSVAAVGFGMAILTLVSRRPALLLPGETRGGTARLVVRELGAPTMFAISAVVALHQPFLAMKLWWLVAPSVIVSRLLGRWAERLVDEAVKGKAR